MNKLVISLLSLFCIKMMGMYGNNSSDFQELVEGNSLFAFDLYHELNVQKGNLFFSPYNISTAFSMVALGAKEDTFKEMEKVLYLKNNPELINRLNQSLTDFADVKNNSQLIMSNALWVEEGFPLLPTFQDALKKTYQATSQSVSFTKNPVEALKAINGWVSQSTKGKINQLLTAQDITSNTRLVLTSAIYMKGRWTQLFDQHDTLKNPFYVSEKHSVQVEMMRHTKNYSLLTEPTFDMIELPYLNPSSRGPDLAMVILLPKEMNGLDVLEREFSYDRWMDWNRKMKTKNVKLSLPKFRIEERMDLNQTMVELGLVKAFSPEADFSGITGERNLFINKAAHKTFVQVDESGTEAAAATGISMNVTSMYHPEEPYVLTIDHPFIFLILDKKTETILFMGRLMQP